MADVFERGLLASYDLQDDVERPEFYRAGAYRDAKGKLMLGGKGLVLEAAWPTDKSGALRHHARRCRYPIAYPGEHADGATGYDVWFSAPFSSDAARHGLGAQSEAWNNKLVGNCDDLARRALSEVLLPQVGAPALTLIAGLADQHRLKTLLNGLVKDRSLPAVAPDGKATRIAKGTQLLGPTYTWDLTSWSPLLAKVCPPASVIVAPRTPGAILARLSREAWMAGVTPTTGSTKAMSSAAYGRPRRSTSLAEPHGLADRAPRSRRRRGPPRRARARARPSGHHKAPQAAGLDAARHPRRAHSLRGP